MKRISTNMPSYDSMFYTRYREWLMNQMNNKIAAQTRIKNLRDDPLAAAKSTRFKSDITRLKQYTKNIETMRGNLSLIEGNLRSGLDILQRIRELAVQGANGTLNKSQMAYIGDEVNELLKAFVDIANAKGGDGKSLFGGYMINNDAFRVTTGNVPGAKGQVITSVDYIGNIGENEGEISKFAFESVNIPGNEAFWAENQIIYSNVDARNYRAPENSAIRIDGVNIDIKKGDNIYAIISKINDSAAPVKAKLDPVRNALVLQSTYPHEIWVEDVGNGNVLKDLGIVSTNNTRPPLNYAKTADVFGGSIFDMIIRLRDSLYEGNYEEVGGSGLQGIDSAIDSLTSTIADIGAKDSRLQITFKRLNSVIPDFVNMDSKEVDLDITEAVTNLKMLEYAHQAALQTAARVLRPTLLDFLR